MFREKKNKSWEENFLLEIREKWEKTEKIYSSVYYTYLPGIITTVRLSIKKYPTHTRSVRPGKSVQTRFAQWKTALFRQSEQ